MRLTTWNCEKGKGNDIDQCLSQIEPLDADLVALQECRRPSRNDPSVVWRGRNPKLGTAVISRRAELKLEPLAIPSPRPSVIPVVVQGPAPFLFVGVWTQKPYIEVAQAAMKACADVPHGLPIVAAGDFSISPAVSRKRQKSLRFLDWMRDELGLVSAYHEFSGETPGEETQPTYYHHWAESKPFHIDYCFLPESWSSRISSVDVGTYADWQTSDHRPLTVDLRDPA